MPRHSLTMIKTDRRLQLLSTYLQQDDDATAGLEYVMNLMVRLSMIEGDLQKPDFEKGDERRSKLVISMRASTVKICTKVLHYHIMIIRHYNGHKVKRFFKDAMGNPQWREQQQEIEKLDIEIDKQQRQLGLHSTTEAFQRLDARLTMQDAAAQQTSVRSNLPYGSIRMYIANKV